MTRRIERDKKGQQINIRRVRDIGSAEKEEATVRHRRGKQERRGR